MFLANQNNNQKSSNVAPRFYPGNTSLNKNADGLICSINTTSNNVQISRYESRIDYYRNQKPPSQSTNMIGTQNNTTTNNTLFNGQQQQQPSLFGAQNNNTQQQGGLFNQQTTGLGGLGTNTTGLGTGLGGGLGLGQPLQQQGLGGLSQPTFGGLTNNTGLGATPTGLNLGGTGLNSLMQNPAQPQQQQTGLFNLGQPQQQQQQIGLFGPAQPNTGLLASAQPQNTGLGMLGGLGQNQPQQQQNQLFSGLQPQYQQQQPLQQQQQQQQQYMNPACPPMQGYQQQMNYQYPQYPQISVDLGFDSKNELEKLQELDDEFKRKIPTFSEYAQQNEVTLNVGNINLRIKNPQVDIKIKPRKQNNIQDDIKPYYASFKKDKEIKSTKEQINKQLYKSLKDKSQQSSQLIIQQEQQQSQQQEQKEQEQQINQRAPKCKDFILNPSIEQLQKMNDNKLTRVRDFRISNQYGQIQFLEAVDLKDLNIDQIVKLKQDTVEFYPDEQFGQVPEYGKGLNVKCKVTLKNFACENRKMCELRINDKKEFEKIIKNWMDKNNMKFISANDDVIFLLDQL